MTPNRANHPPRRGIEIEKHKGGRTARLNARFTEAEKAAIMAAAHAAGLSVSDFIISLMAQAQPTPVAADALCDCYISVPAGNYPDLCAHCGKKARR